jgi:Lipocalin-like domain
MKSTIFALAFFSLTLPAFGQGASLKEQLIGAWSLVSCNGTDGPSCVGDPNGIHILDASGHYVMVIAARGRPKLTDLTQPRLALSAEEYKAAAVGLVANFGTWSVNEATITYHVDGALFPGVEGAEFKGTISLSEDELKIANQFNQYAWRRIKK